MNRPLIVALDFPSRTEVKDFLSRLEGESLYVKVGMELFYREGSHIITFLKEQGHQIFLDLKLHDIPNTVKSAMRNLASLEVDLVNVHAAGGSKMMMAALEGLDMGTPSGKKRPHCIAVTQLTSTSSEILHKELLISESLNQVVVHYAKLAKESRLDGVVCSTWEAEMINEACGADFITVTPGIRLQEDAVDDQVRIATPEEARRRGSWGIVVGRSITKAVNPMETYNLMKQQWEG
ncbi:orotidine-5'-phosphate decarboxylase [Bacillus sp. Marseille-P3661]|uniref:orotidine-5'-phosphate decarboxylase n=1 Tax=Bacillus sp. Marseille-P3661 TaxID=1936234 RepID=UPI000C8462EE|nr:orotidine-5'-phosphate decarboxylase [Bacillus sp. Marseille-P3661]